MPGPCRSLTVPRWKSHGIAHPLRSKSGLPETRPTSSFGWDDDVDASCKRNHVRRCFSKDGCRGAFIDACQRGRVFGSQFGDEGWCCPHGRQWRERANYHRRTSGAISTLPRRQSRLSRHSSPKFTLGRTSYRGFLKNFYGVEEARGSGTQLEHGPGIPSGVSIGP